MILIEIRFICLVSRRENMKEPGARAAIESFPLVSANIDSPPYTVHAMIAGLYLFIHSILSHMCFELERHVKIRCDNSGETRKISRLASVRCPGGLAFDIEKQTCDWKTNVKNCKSVESKS
jgi:hypothetical protein